MNENKISKHQVYEIEDFTVAIWWYTESGQIWDFRKSRHDGYIYQNGYVIYSNKEKHQTLWDRIIYKCEPDTTRRTELRKKGYDYYERGYVIYNMRTAACEIWCIGDNLYNSVEFRKKITRHFGLSYARTDFYRIDEMDGEIYDKEIIR